MKKISLMLAFVGMFSAAGFANGHHPQSKAPQDGSKKQSTEKVSATPAVKKETTAPAPKKETTAPAQKKHKPVKKVASVKPVPAAASSTVEQKKK